MAVRRREHGRMLGRVSYRSPESRQSNEGSLVRETKPTDDRSKSPNLPLAAVENALDCAKHARI